MATDTQLVARRRMRNALQAVAEWMESRDGPLYEAWEQGYLCMWENDEWEWERTLDYVQNTSGDPITDRVRVPAVSVYRKVRRALDRSQGVAETQETERVREFLAAARDHGYDAAVEVLGDPLAEQD